MGRLGARVGGRSCNKAKLWVGLGPGLVDDLVTRLNCG